MDHADVLTAADGRPRGCGTVLLSTKADAARAIGEFVMVGLWCGGSYRDQRDHSKQQYSRDYGARLFARLLCWWGVNEKGFDICLCVVKHMVGKHIRMCVCTYLVFSSLLCSVGIEAFDIRG